MLLGKDLRRRHQRALVAAFCNAVAERRRDRRLSAADFALHKAVHCAAALHIRDHFRDAAPLGAGRGKRQKAVKILLHRSDKVIAFDLAFAAELRDPELEI